MTSNEDTSTEALLVADDARRDEHEPSRLIGRVRVAGHPLRVILDFTRQDLGLIEYVEMPWLLGMHPPSQRAVVRLMSRVYGGEAIQFPYDLSGEVRDSSPPFPFEPL